MLDVIFLKTVVILPLHTSLVPKFETRSALRNGWAQNIGRGSPMQG